MGLGTVAGAVESAVFSGTTEQKSLGINDLDIGISSEGMSTYKENLKTHLLDNTISELNTSYTEIMKVINLGWQGVARDRFDQKFNDTCKQIGEDLSAEYTDLCARLDEIQAYYYEQDLKLIDE